MKTFTLSSLSFLSGVGAALTSSATPNNDAMVYAPGGPFRLSSDGVTPDILIIDFGQSYEGHPTFEVVSAAGDTSCFEVSYAEAAASFSNYAVSPSRPRS